MNKKNIIIIIMTIVLIITLVIGTGITSAYFMINIKNDITEPTTVKASLGKNAKAVLTQEESAKNLRINIKASDMSMANAIHEVEYYADNMNDYVTEQSDGMKKLTTLSIQDSEEDLILKEDLSNIVDDIEAGGKEYNINYIIEGNGSDDLLGYVKLNNRTDKDQSYIADKKLNIEIKVEELNCDTITEHPLITKLRSTDRNHTLSTKLTGGMYRYQGSSDKVTNNYVCLGSDCSDDTDKMYRIIGITADGEMKLIKKEALEDTYQWYTNYNEDIKWPKSKIYENISGAAFLNNTNYIPEGWQSKIKDTNWIYGDMLSSSRLTGPELYKTELGLKTALWNEKSTEEAGGTKQATTAGTVFYYKAKNEYWTDYITSKVGLMYVSDYYLATSDTVNCQYTEGVEKYTVCREQGWLHISKNDDVLKNGDEWTILRYGWGISDGIFYARRVLSVGSSDVWNLAGSLSVRPVFYLTNGIVLTGEGTIEEPFIIN